jgi:hypothetical protein
VSTVHTASPDDPAGILYVQRYSLPTYEASYIMYIYLRRDENRRYRSSTRCPRRIVLSLSLEREERGDDEIRILILNTEYQYYGSTVEGWEDAKNPAEKTYSLPAYTFSRREYVRSRGVDLVEGQICDLRFAHIILFTHTYYIHTVAIVAVSLERNKENHLPSII